MRRIAPLTFLLALSACSEHAGAPPHVAAVIAELHGHAQPPPVDIGPEIGPDGRISPFAPAYAPAVAYGAGIYLVTWRDSTSFFASRVTSAGEVLDPNGIAIAPDDPSIPGFAAVAFDGTRFAIVLETPDLAGVDHYVERLVYVSTDGSVSSQEIGHSALPSEPRIACRPDGVCRLVSTHVVDTRCDFESSVVSSEMGHPPGAPLPANTGVLMLGGPDAPGAGADGNCFFWWNGWVGGADVAASATGFLVGWGHYEYRDAIARWSVEEIPYYGRLSFLGDGSATLPPLRRGRGRYGASPACSSDACVPFWLDYGSGPDAIQTPRSTLPMQTHPLFGLDVAFDGQHFVSVVGTQSIEVTMAWWTEDGELLLPAPMAVPEIGTTYPSSLASDGRGTVLAVYERDGIRARFISPASARCSDDAECASGFCVDGVCCDSACGGGDPHDCLACSRSTGAATNGVCEPAASNTICRPSDGRLCDEEERCDGVSSVCPVDLPASVGTECRSSDGECDPTERCDGVSFDCPLDALVAALEPCFGYGAYAVCNQVVCSGTSPYCEHDDFYPAWRRWELSPDEAVCRAADDECDVIEVCTSPGACPADRRAPNGTPCSVGVCFDGACVASLCDGGVSNPDAGTLDASTASDAGPGDAGAGRVDSGDAIADASVEDARSVGVDASMDSGADPDAGSVELDGASVGFTDASSGRADGANEGPCTIAHRGRDDPAFLVVTCLVAALLRRARRRAGDRITRRS